MFKIISTISLLLFVGCTTVAPIDDAPYIVIPPAPVNPPDVPPDNPVVKKNLVFINSDSEYDNIRDKENSVRYFFATWCGPCKQQGPVYEELARDNPNVMFYKIDVDKCKKSTRSMGVSGIPSIFVKRTNVIGFQPKSSLQNLIDKEF